LLARLLIHLFFELLQLRFEHADFVGGVICARWALIARQSTQRRQHNGWLFAMSVHDPAPWKPV
jgi:hypothetical protein